MEPDEIARGRIKKLLALAREMLDEDEKLSKRYVELARKLAKRHRVKLGSKLFCKECGVIFIPGKTLKVRVSKGVPIYVCLKCGAAHRVSTAKKK